MNLKYIYLIVVPVVLFFSNQKENDQNKEILHESPDPVATVLKADPDSLLAQPTKGFRITYYWQALSLEKDYKVVVRVVNKDGETVLKDDHQPPKPTSKWGDRVQYTLMVSLPVWDMTKDNSETKYVGLSEGKYSVLAGLYDEQTKQLQPLKRGPGVKKEKEGLYKIGVLTLDSLAPVPEPGEPTLDLTGYDLTFNEEFDSLSVSAWGPAGEGGTRWIAHTPWHGDFGDAEFADPKPGFPFTVNNGILRIEARKKDGKWQSGLLSAVDPEGNGFAQQYGYFECRAKFPKGPGTWPAFWLMGKHHLKDSEKPRINPEVDIVEHYGHWPNRFSYVLHLWEFGGIENKHQGERFTVFGMEEDFHTYGVMINEDYITLYFDGVKMHRRETPEGVKTPLYPLVNLALGPGWPLDKTPNPCYMYVDYIKVYSK